MDTQSETLQKKKKVWKNLLLVKAFKARYVILKFKHVGSIRKKINYEDTTLTILMRFEFNHKRQILLSVQNLKTMY